MAKLSGDAPMDHGTQEIRRVYRLDFDHGEASWDDPMPPEITSDVLGRRATSIINRTSLLAWSLMNLRHVDVADLSFGGWIKISITTGPDFDEGAFQREVAEVVHRVSQVVSDRALRRTDMHSLVESTFSLPAGFAAAQAPA
jgi:hypothetical protein